MEQIALTTADHYFDVLNTGMSLELSELTQHQSRFLYSVAEQRFKLSAVSQGELLQLRLHILKAEQQVTQDSIQHRLARKQLARYLNLPNNVDFSFEIPDQLRFNVLDINEVLRRAHGRGYQSLEMQLQKLEANQSLAQAKAEHGLKLRITANIGTSGTSRRLGELWHGMENQQQVLFGFSIPLVDWNYSRINRQRAEANLSMIESQHSQQELNMEHELAQQVARWNLQKRQLEVARESQSVAAQHYELELQRFLLGLISLNDLNSAQNARDQASNAYLSSLRTYWLVYFSLRKITLYDFFEDRPIQFVRKISR